MRIDVHAHYFPAQYMEFLNEHGGRSGPPRPDVNITLEQRLALLDQVGIDLQVLSVAAVTPYHLPEAADVAEASRLANNLYVELCQRHAGRFAVFATVPLPDV